MITFVPDTEPLSNRDRKMLDRAIEIAKTSTVRHKHGAVVYKGGRVLSVGVNTIRNVHHTMEINPKDYTTHAEIAAVRALGSPYINSPVGTTIYVARVNRNGHSMLSAPCPDCVAKLWGWGVKRVVFTS